ncbi:MAG: hypothetical protein M3N54_13460 [Acidobacteriota bacterium]|nr:hypothetical protein [Acidobacteriota bacterium]
MAGAITLICATALPSMAQAPAWDNSGNSLLHGSYYFREVIYLVGDNAGDLSRALAVYGNITFDGNGNYTIAGAQVLDSSVGRTQTLAINGTYSVAASGFGFFTNPLSTSTNVLTIRGLVSNGIIIGSDTEDGFNEMFVAAPVSSPLAAIPSFHGSYSVAAFLPVIGQSEVAYNADASFQLNPDGAGNLGTVNINGYFGGGGSKVYTQSTAAVKYFFSNGAGVITFPSSTTANFFVGQEYVYMSADGNFIFGGSPLDYDFFVGVRTPAANTPQPFGGIYYEAGIDNDASQLLTAGFSDLDSFYGSFSATGGNIVGHERLSDVFNNAPEGFTYAATYPSPVTGTYTAASGSTQYTVSNNGIMRIGFGVGPFLGISVALQAPTLTGTGVFLNPTGIANAASAAPFTAGISPGEFIVLYGTNMAPAGTTVATGLPFPTSLGGVQVTVNGLPAPLYYVSPTQIAAIVPYGITYSIGQIQVTNNGVPSNSVTELVNKTSPGIFTLSANGLGYGAMEHALDGTVVTASHPAQPGEPVAVYMSGLGAVFPPVPEGSPGPSPTLSNTTNTITAYVGGIAATVGYAGLAPFLAGLYQVNLTIPATATAGDNLVSISGPDSYTSQALISVGTGTAATAAVSAAQAAPKRLNGPVSRR